MKGSDRRRRENKSAAGKMAPAKRSDTSGEPPSGCFTIEPAEKLHAQAAPGRPHERLRLLEAERGR
jgi:hypothetical protein